MTKRKRRKYTKEFKEEAVKLVTEQGYLISEAARNLGIHENLLGKWKRDFSDSTTDSLSSDSPAALKAELTRLRKENKQLKMEREILKKATVDSIDQRNTLYYDSENNNMEVAHNEAKGSSWYDCLAKGRSMVPLAKW